jgi:CRISPR type I-E-associated protein CasB/Cse2
MLGNESGFPAERFVARLSGMDVGDRARFRRNAGKSLTESSDVLASFYHLLPAGVPPSQEEGYFLVATLYPLAESAAIGDLGVSLRRARSSTNAKGLDRRVEFLLDADPAQLPFRLRQVVRFLASNRVPVDWPLLLKHVLAWTHPDRFVQQRWARSYFAGESKP